MSSISITYNGITGKIEIFDENQSNKKVFIKISSNKEKHFYLIC
jgi:hypothetical protein